MMQLLPKVRAFIEAVQPLRIGAKGVQTQKRLQVMNPSDGKPLAQVSMAGAGDVDAAVGVARTAFDDGRWTAISATERSRLLGRLANLIERDADIFAQLDCLDNGKPFSKVRNGDVQASVHHMRYFAGWADRNEGRTIPVQNRDRLVYTVNEPIGVCGLICPWNYPLLMAIWKLAPALAAGNTIVLKPSEETPLSALYLADLALEAGLPEGVLNVISGLGATTGAALVAHRDVDKIGFTGSTQTGIAIAQSAAVTLKRVSLELGGKAANIVFPDADLDAAIHGALWAAMGNNGQSCTAGAKLYVHESVHDQIVERIVALVADISIGPGTDVPEHDLGPLISHQQRDKVAGFVAEATAQSALVAVGGQIPDRPGWFIEPTVLTGVSEDMRVARQEVFGPLVTIHTFSDEDDVIARANSTPFGLAAGLWSCDIARVKRVSSRLKAGTVWTNCWGETDPAVPFGGIKQSGYGREMGQEAMALYSQTKSVWIA